MNFSFLQETDLQIRTLLTGKCFDSMRDSPPRVGQLGRNMRNHYEFTLLYTITTFLLRKAKGLLSLR